MENKLHSSILKRNMIQSIFVKCVQQWHWSPLLLNCMPLSIVERNVSAVLVGSMNIIGYLIPLGDLVFYIQLVLQTLLKCLK